MSEQPNYRKERILRLIKELEYELVRGIMDREIDEEFTWRYMLPFSNSIPNGHVFMEFRTRPMPSGYTVPGFPPHTRLKIVGEET